MQVEDRTGRYPVITERRGSIRTHAHAPSKLRKVGFFAALGTVPLGVGALVGARSKTAGIVAGGLTALALGALRLQLQRWFTDEPSYQVEQEFGEVEVRKIRARVEARVHLDTADLETARAQGYAKLHAFIAGNNSTHEKLEMMTPVVSARANGGHEVSFLMPTGRTLMSLPRPDDASIQLREAPERHVAVMRFHGGYEIEPRERHLRSEVAKAGLTAFGPVTFAAFDPPTTLGFLKRTELWLEIE